MAKREIRNKFMKKQFKAIKSFMQATFLLFRKKIKGVFGFKLSRIPLLKIKFKQRNFVVSLPIILAITVGVAGISYGTVEYNKTFSLVKEANRLVKGEKYSEANEKLEFAQNSWLIKNLGIKKQEINNEIEKNKKLDEHKSKYNQGLDRLDKGNYQEAIDLFSEIPEGSFYSNNAKLKTEEAKRKIVEEELGETKIAKKEAEEKAQQESIKRSRAEARAKQEEFEKNIKEQQLSEKEAEEKMMNADNDGDGLTYREEEKKGTSDWNNDSDGDGIIDSKDTHPAGGGRNIPQIFTWSYGGYDWTWTESIQEDWYDYYKAKPRNSPESIEYVTIDDPFIKKIVKKISNGAKGDVNEVWLAISFVQNLPYVEDVFTGYDEYPKYPVETFFEKNGDCEDTSYLTASIIDAMGYGSALILLPGHMAVGVYMNCDNSGTYYELDGRCYYYVETTSKDYAGGEIPDKYRNTRATLIKIPSGETTDVYPKYKKSCEPSSNYPGYYYSEAFGGTYYSDSNCRHQTDCLPAEDMYWNGKYFYWDSNCAKRYVLGCNKSSIYSGLFYDDHDWYYDYQCSRRADPY